MINVQNTRAAKQTQTHTCSHRSKRRRIGACFLGLVEQHTWDFVVGGEVRQRRVPSVYRSKRAVSVGVVGKRISKSLIIDIFFKKLRLIAPRTEILYQIKNSKSITYFLDTFLFYISEGLQKLMKLGRYIVMHQIV